MILALAVLSLSGVQLNARMPAEALEIGGEYQLTVEVGLDGEINPAFPWEEGWNDGGLRRPILLLDVPDCVELLGSVPVPLETPGDFQLDFLRYPYGRRLMAAEETVRFKLVSEPGKKDRIGLNLVVYPGTLGTDSEDDSSFERLRADLLVKKKARAKGKSSRVSTWGPARGVHIGDEAPDFELTRLDGSKLVLSSFRGESNVLLVTYRRET